MKKNGSIPLNPESPIPVPGCQDLQLGMFAIFKKRYHFSCFDL